MEFEETLAREEEVAAEINGSISRYLRDKSSRQNKSGLAGPVVELLKTDRQAHWLFD